MDWYPKINDPSLKYITPEYSVEVYQTDVIITKVESFFNWKSNCSKYKCIYIKIYNSEYIYSIVPTLKDQVVGIWSISENIGFITKFIYFKPLLNLVDLYTVIPPNQLELSNSIIFSYDSTEHLKSIKKYAKELFTKFLLDSNYKNVSKETLAVKAIKASHTFHQSIEDYSHLYFSARGK